MANPYQANDLDPFAEDFRRAPPPGVAPAQPQWSAPPPPQAPPAQQFYTPSGISSAAGSSQPYVPLPPGVEYAPQQQPPPPHAAGQSYAQPQQPGQPHPQHAAGQIPPESRELQTSKFWTIGFYRQFFDINTKQVLLRMSNTLAPINPPDFLIDRNWHHNAGQAGDPQAQQPTVIEGVEINKNPDLYGPFWICTTLWMILAIVSNIMSKIAHDRVEATYVGGTRPPSTKWSYDFSVAPVAAITIYAYCFGMAALVWGLMKWKNLPVALADTLCLYGYSMFIFLLAAILCMAPVVSAQWFVVIFCGAWSVTYLLINFWHLWKVGMEPCWFMSVVLLVIVAHLLITMSFKFYFLNYAL